MGCFWKQAIFGKNSKGNPFKNSILGPLFWAVLDARSFFWTFFGKCPFGGGEQKKVWFFHFFVKIEKISKFGLFPLTYYILEPFRHVPFWKNIATRGKKNMKMQKFGISYKFLTLSFRFFGKSPNAIHPITLNWRRSLFKKWPLSIECIWLYSIGEFAKN